VPGWEFREQHLDAVAAAGFASVRLPVRWWGHAQDGPPYVLETSFQQRVGAVVKAVQARGLGLVLSMHHADGMYADGLGALPRLSALWRQIAEQFAGAPPDLAYDLLNEPHAPMTSRQWSSVLPMAMKAIRDVDPERTVVVAAAESSTIAGLRGLELPPDQNLVVTVHYYEPFSFTHQGAPWISGASVWMGTDWGSSNDHLAVTRDLEAAAGWAQSRGVPLYIGEFGAYAAAEHAARVRWTRWVRTEADRLGLPWAYWDLATDFGVYDLDRDGWREDLLDALMGQRPED
jgi:endoglucanase